ncbi:unnamed protein product [Pleuronectes platessa]|uniref:Uncharacterized protein n=1 Tax=Pleuronectes platessa TaxID=8262 RepID=A0A9N7TPA7_PLEPL|nr:unnamed protein product [Pleuronectes platessa]
MSAVCSALDARVKCQGWSPRSGALGPGEGLEPGCLTGIGLLVGLLGRAHSSSRYISTSAAAATGAKKCGTIIYRTAPLPDLLTSVLHLSL